VTFRSRVITATVAAAALAVVLACFASFLTTRNALFTAVDQSLLQSSQGPNTLHADEAHVTGSYTELVLANGQTVPTTGVPIDSVIRTYAKGKSGHLLRTIQIGNQSYRELIVGLPSGSVVSCTSATGLCQVPSTSAQLFVVNVTGQENELRSLVRTLLVVAASGLLLALAMGWLLARAALRPSRRSPTRSRRSPRPMTCVIASKRETPTSSDVCDGLQPPAEFRREQPDFAAPTRTRRESRAAHAAHLTADQCSGPFAANELSPEDLTQLTNDMVTQVDELASLVTDLGELARGERSEGAVVSLRLDECVDVCVDTARTYARIKDITIDSEVEPSMIEGRRDRLERAISNLLTNAVKFTPHGGRIKVASSSGTVSVSDSGPAS